MDWKSPKKLPEEAIVRAKALSFQFPSFIREFKNGVALVEWQLNSDGKKYLDDNEYGMTPDQEINIYGFIDTEGKVVVKFQLINELKDLEKLRKIAKDGCVIFAFGYLNASDGCIHKNVVGQDRIEKQDRLYSSPWLHIEAALANIKQIPCLIIYDTKLCRDGMFDDAIIKSDKNMCAFPYSDDMSNEDKLIMRQWFSLVQEYHYKRTKQSK